MHPSGSLHTLVSRYPSRSRPSRCLRVPRIVDAVDPWSHSHVYSELTTKVAHEQGVVALRSSFGPTELCGVQTLTKSMDADE